MSIELILTELTAALRANTEAANLLTQSLAGRSAPAAKGAADKAAAGKSVAADKPKEEPKADPEPEVVDEAPGAVSYETVRNLVLKLAPTSRDAIKALNGKHGIGTLRDLLADEKDFASVKDQSKLEAIHADLLELEAV